MAILFESLKNIYASNSKKAFSLSLLAVACWLVAISIAVFSQPLALEYTSLIISAFLLFSAIFSMNAIPRKPRSHLFQQAARKNRQMQQH